MEFSAEINKHTPNRQLSEQIATTQAQFFVAIIAEPPQPSNYHHGQHNGSYNNICYKKTRKFVYISKTKPVQKCRSTYSEANFVQQKCQRKKYEEICMKDELCFLIANTHKFDKINL